MPPRRAGGQPVHPIYAPAAMLASVPTILIVIVLQRYLIQGLVAGAVKE